MQLRLGAPRRVLVIGAGLIGTSVGLALTRGGAEVFLEDADSGNVRTAVSLGAGRAAPSDDAEIRPDLVVVGVPPVALAAVIATALERFPDAVVSDLGSVKEAVLAELRRRGIALERYVGSHPMAGSEQSGPLAGRADLFEGRAWAVTPHDGSTPEAVSVVEEFARTCGAFVVSLTPARHDGAVALVSHVPQVASSVVAGLLIGAEEDDLRLAGQGLRDVTRIASSDTELWTQILTANAGPVAKLLHEASERLRDVALTLDKLPAGEHAETAPGGGVSVAADRPGEDLRAPLAQGVTGVHRLPGKHGARVEDFVQVPILLSDRPGELARLFADVGEAGVNIEDVRIDHSPGTPAGLVELSVRADTAEGLLHALAARGWVVHG